MHLGQTSKPKNGLLVVNKTAGPSSYKKVASKGRHSNLPLSDLPFASNETSKLFNDLNVKLYYVEARITNDNIFITLSSLEDIGLPL